MFSRAVAVAALALLAAAPVQGSARRSQEPAAPTGLKAFLLRADERPADSFPRTPSFAWTPYKGALRYEFEVATSRSFDESSIVWSTRSLSGPLRSPAVAVPVSLPWMTGKPYALYAHVRALTRRATTPWSSPFGFNMRWKNLPEQITPDYPGLIRWTPVEGATSYDVWFVDAAKVISTVTNVADEREHYSFHQDALWTGQVRWRVRAERKIYGKIPSGLPVVVYGPWSSTFTSTNPDLGVGQFMLTAALSNTVSTPRAAAAHTLTPGYVFTGNESLAGVQTDLYRVYVSTDSQCVNIVFKGAVVGSPAYAPRITGPIALPASVEALTAAQTAYAADGPQTGTFTADYVAVTPTEQGSSSSSSGSGSSGETTTPIPPEFNADGALVDLWDSGWPTGRFYWTVVPVNRVTTGSSISYYDAEVPQDACAAGRVASFGKTSEPVTTGGGRPYVTGLSPNGRLLTATSVKPAFYGTPLVAWEPVLGATGYEVQWSRTLSPWRPARASVFTAATSALLEGLKPGTWYYRVRGIDPYLPGPLKQMAWSTPVLFVIAKAKFKVVG